MASTATAGGREVSETCEHPAGATIPHWAGWKCLDCGAESLSFTADEIESLRAEIERLRGEIDEQRKLRNHFAEQAAHWNALYAAERQRADHAEAEWRQVSGLLEEADKEYAAERQRARLPEDLADRLRSIVDFHGPKSTTKVLVDILAWHDSAAVEQGEQ